MSNIKKIYNVIYYSWYYGIPLVSLLGAQIGIPITIGYILYNQNKERNKSISLIKGSSKQC